MPASSKKKLPDGIVDLGFDIEPPTITHVWTPDPEDQAAAQAEADAFNDEEKT